MTIKRNSKPAREWANFCKDNYNIGPDDVSDAHELANNRNMRDKLDDKRIKYLQSIVIPEYTSK